MLRACAVALVPLAVVGAGVVPRGEARAAPPATIKLGLHRAMFRDTSPAMIQVAAAPFRDLLKRQSGLDGQVELVEGYEALAAKLEAKEVQFGVFHGFEWAWVRGRHPDLQALAVTMPPGKRLHAAIVVHQDSPAKTRADLTADPVAVPAVSKAHCLLYLERLRTTLPEGAARQVDVPDAGTDELLDRVVVGKVAAAVVDGAALDAYRANKPGPAGVLRVLSKSDPFPPAAVVFKRGAVDAATVDKIRSGLVKASTNPHGKAFLFLWHLKGFEEPTANYEADLQQVLKAYPPPK